MTKPPKATAILRRPRAGLLRRVPDAAAGTEPAPIATYRDAFMLFLAFAQSRLGKSPTTMAMADITPELIIAFLDHLERQRHNCVRSRNARLATLRSLNVDHIKRHHSSGILTSIRRKS